MNCDLTYMQEALAQARHADRAGEVPVGAVIVLNGAIIATGHNQSIANCDPSAHAEMIALREAAATLGNYRLPGSELYVTLEPCAMCFTAMVHARIKRLVYGATDTQKGVCGGAFSIADLPIFNHRFEITKGVLQDQCSASLKDFFRERRAEQKL